MDFECISFIFCYNRAIPVRIMESITTENMVEPKTTLLTQETESAKEILMPCPRCRTQMDWLPDDGYWRCPSCGQCEID